MGIQNEIEFENDICAHLAAHGWLYSPTDAGYDRERALFPEDAIAWAKETQPKAWAGLAAFHNGAPETEFINRLASVLIAEGTLYVLRHGFKATGAGTAFSVVQYRPAFGFNDEIAEIYARNRLRVMRQVHYSASNQNCIDLVLFVNGIPVATIELKTDFTQAVEDAKRQYQKDRLPKDPVTHKEEPLLTFKRGALVHFAASTEEVWMTTKLSGPSTYFLPFNKGNAGGKGNPANDAGYRAAYFWEEILQRDTWLRILGSFIQLEPKQRQGAKGKTTKEGIIFPRYHQLDAVTKLIDAARTEGPGHNYLFQHSAGSGKSNTIGWCAHQLATLHDANDAKVFDTVIVITDRTVLDAQLKETIKQFQSVDGVVVSVDSEKGSKSGQLAAALKKKALIVVVTLQTFPFIMAEIRQSEGMSQRKFAVIIDEAHSSQSGASARQLRGVLASSVPDDDEELTVEDLLLAEAEGRKLPKNASFLAFTATPKSKTLEVFGRPPDPAMPIGPANLPVPFHEYTMRQAIEEEFILDVLRNFTPYRVAYKLAHNGKDWDDAEVDKSAGLKALYRWVRLHPYNIGQKVEIVVEHFRQTVAHHIGGKAKAMVVTGSRQEAVRYKLAMDLYIAKSGYKDIATLVAFSGDVIDTESGPEKFTEDNMNRIHGRSIRGAFDTDEYHVLIVANKFQTGFDQPLLVAMYVDKRLDGITAVQTLSRLNRTHPDKDNTFVLDFVNDAETIRKAFAPYYEHTELLATTDPNLIYTLQTNLDKELIYTDQEALNVAAVALGYQRGTVKQAQKALIAALSAPVDRFKKRWMTAELGDDKEELERLTTFHNNLSAFYRLYDFISQIVSYGDPALEARYALYKHLEPLIRPDRIRLAIDLSDVVLTHHKVRHSDSVAVPLDAATVAERTLKPYTAVGTHAPRDPIQMKLAQLIEQLNTLFDDASLTDADKVGLFNHVADKMMENEEINKQALANSKEQFEQSPAITRVVINAVIAAMDNYQTMGSKIFQDQAAMDRFKGMLVDHVYDRVNAQAPPGI
jgi:type I restriction enzyme R subunit